MPDGSEVEMRVFNEFQRLAASPEDAANFIASITDTDVRALAQQIRVPALVLHLRGDQIVPYECGREIAAQIPGAKLTTFEGRNHAMTNPQEIIGISRIVSAFFDEGLEKKGPATAGQGAEGSSAR